jgi:hypothetical protein
VQSIWCGTRSSTLYWKKNPGGAKKAEVLKENMNIRFAETKSPNVVKQYSSEAESGENGQSV